MYRKIVNVEPDGKKKEYTMFSVKKGLDKVAALFLAPASEKGRSTLRVGENMWLYIPNGGKPIRITGELAAGASSTFTGPTYISTGPDFGGAWNNGAVAQRKVGTMTFALAGVTTGQLTYSVDGVTVSTPVQRQSLTTDSYGGTYIGAMTYTISSCADTAKNVTATTAGLVTIVQDDALAYMSLPIAEGGTCTINATYSQLGRMGQMGGAFSCTNGESGNALVFQMTNQPFMFMARMTLQNPETGCDLSGEVIGLIPR